MKKLTAITLTLIFCLALSIPVLAGVICGDCGSSMIVTVESQTSQKVGSVECTHGGDGYDDVFKVTTVRSYNCTGSCPTFTTTSTTYNYVCR